MSNTKTMSGSDLNRLLELLDTQFKDYNYSQIGLALMTIILYTQHLKYNKLPNDIYVDKMESATASIIASIMSSLSATIMKNIPTETEH
jgi:hypothetical protein